ncbi:hypothetical protein ACIRTB_34685 [Streptomyces sp. NPDC101158]|uniref:hypothetical protein n=1 Tax=Streptomyces sp. NPDC101158 TaxID=3366117 RepID=UPI003827B11D
MTLTVMSFRVSEGILRFLRLPLASCRPWSVKESPGSFTYRPRHDASGNVGDQERTGQGTQVQRRARGVRRQLVNPATGEVHELWEEERRRLTYEFGGRHGQFSFPRVMEMLAGESGITGDAFRVFFYFAIQTYEKGGATATEAAKYLGLTPQATRRIAKQLAENKIFLVEEVIGRTIKYRASPHIVSSLSGQEQALEAAAYHLPTMPGRPAAAKDQSDVSKPVPRARRVAAADKRSASPEAEHANDVRDSRRAGAPRREDRGRAG